MASSEIIKNGPNITMMVADYPLDTPIDMRVAFSLLPIFRPGKFEITKGQKLPHYKTPSAIITADYEGETRGIIRKKSSFFKNSVSIDISCISKNVNIKLSTQNIHLCGITTESMIEEVVDYIIFYIREIQELLTYAEKNPDLRDKTIEWLKDASMGICMKRTETFYNVTGKISINKITKYNLIRAISGKEVSNSPNEKLAKLYLRMLPDVVYHKDYCRLLNWCKNITYVSDNALSKLTPVIHVKNTNSRFRFDIGICFIFAILFKDNFPDYIINYDNAMKPSTINITIPYIPDETKLTKKKTRYVHTFMLQSSGSFTHSGPGNKELEIGYSKFISAMEIMERLIPRTKEDIMEIATKYL